VPSPPSDVPRRQSILQDDSASIGQAISTRSNSDNAIYVPIRRRSLLAHGVATRTSYVEPDLPQSHPPRADSLKDLTNYYYDPTKPTSSPLSELEMLGPNPAFMHEGPRAETPTEMGYGHLGGFSGKLRITNGAASPAPSSRRANSLGAEDDFFETRKNAEMGHRPGLSQRSNTISVAGEVIKGPWSVHSPLRTSEVQSEPLMIDTHREKDVSQPSLHSEKERNVLKKIESPTKGQQAATGRQDGVLSPFSFDTSPTSPQFQATSKHTAVEDELFEVEPESPDPSVDQASHAPRSFDSGYGGGENSPPGVPAKKFPEASSSGLAKADSGYSSNVSLRSFKKDSSPASTRRTLNEPDSRVASSNSSVESDAALKARDFEASLSAEEAPAPPAKQPAPPFRQPPPVPMGDQSFAGTPRNVQPPLIPRVTALAGQAAPQAYGGPISSSENSHQQSALAIASTAVRDDSAADSDISASAPANSSSRWRQKLTKRESQPRIATKQVFTVQAMRSPSEAYKIPPPTMEARRRLEEREDAFPVQCFPNTVENTVASKRMSMNTIFSVGSLEASDESQFGRLQSGVPPVPPMPTIIQEPNQETRPDKTRRNTYQAPTQDAVQPPTQESQSSQPASPERGRSQRASWARQFLQIMPRDRTAAPPEDLGFLESHVTSFETVSHSLGRDAYDIARPDPPAEPVDSRAKSMTQRFEADAAARFAASKQRNASAEPAIRPRKSYDSVMNGNRYSPGSGQSTTNNLRDSRDFSHVVQNSAMRRSYTNLPAQSSLLNPAAVPALPAQPSLNATERRKSSNSPPPVATPVRGQSVTRKPVPSPQSSRPSSIHTRKTAPSPLSQHQDGAWAKRRLSTTSLVSMRTTMTFDSSRTRPETYEIIPIDDFKKKHPKRGSTINLSSFSGEDHDYRPSSSKGSTKSSLKGSTTKARKRISQSRESLVINMRDRDVIPRTNYPTLGRKSLENMRPRSKGALDAVSERDEIPNFGEQPAMPSPLTENPNLNLKDRRWKEELKRKSQIADPSVTFGEEAVPPLPRQKMKARKSEETLTLRDLQQQELASRRPRSVQPSRAESKRIREEERTAEERSQRMIVEKERAKERVKEKRKSRWDAYTHIFGERGKSLKKEQISAPIPMDRAELERSYSATPVY